MFTLGYWRGLRASEYGLLQLEHYRQESGRLYVPRVKGSVAAEYRLCRAELQALRAWLKVRGLDAGPLFPSRRGLPVSRQQVHKLFSCYASRAGWPEGLSHAHTLRHSIAVHLLEKGVDIYAVKDWLGHSTIQSTEVYAQITTPVREKAAELAYQDEKQKNKVEVEWSRDRRRVKPQTVQTQSLAVAG
jgi:site-specific recombinase XerC